jgi:23S rRNA (guanosine2251-2'-O)-methyltransferase
MPNGRMTHVIPGRRPVAEALRAQRRLYEIVMTAEGQRGPSARELRRIEVTASRAGLPVRHTQPAELDALSGGVRHQGVVALAPAFSYLELAPACEGTDLVVVLDGITDPQNLGAIARSAEAAGAGALIVPRRRAGGVGPAAEKAAAGAFSWLRVGLVPNVARALAGLAERGFWSLGLAADAPETLWDSPLLDGKVALVVGAEGSGLSRLVAERVDARLAIPLRGRIESLNASAAAAVALFEVLRRHR